MRVCPNCGKANRPERKFCIRCGSKLVVAKRKRRAKKKIEAPETGRVVTGASVAAAEAAEAEEAAKAAAPKAEIVEEHWVRPSQVPKDRVRTTRKKRGVSELEKAREAFARAERVDIDERMLRASEVKSLFDDMESEPAPSPGVATDMEVPESPTIRTVDEATVDDSAVRILGSMSPIIDSGESALASTVVSPPAEPTPAASSEFSSALYDDMEVEEEQLPEIKPQPPTPSAETVAPPVIEKVAEPVAAAAESEGQMTVCPNCGTVMYVDDFTYESEIYSQMGTARLKQARFFVVQGKYEEARNAIRIARALFSKANDSKGLEQADKLIESLARSA